MVSLTIADISIYIEKKLLSIKCLTESDQNKLIY